MRLNISVKDYAGKTFINNFDIKSIGFSVLIPLKYITTKSTAMDMHIFFNYQFSLIQYCMF